MLVPRILVLVILFCVGCSETVRPLTPAPVPARAIDIADAPVDGADPLIETVTLGSDPERNSEDLFGAAVPPVNGSKPTLSLTETDTESPAMLSMAMTVNEKPRFYTGPMPLKYVAHKRLLTSDSQYTVSHDFGRWKVVYGYADVALKFSGIADSARALDIEGRVLAEATLKEIEAGKGLVVHEFHYNKDGSVRFTCVSRFNFPFGLKESEEQSQGIKHKDFFFLWPCRSF